MAAALVHRAMNERRQRLDAPTKHDSMRCECECHRVECATNFSVTMKQYQQVRAHERWFIVAPGHQRPDEPVLSTDPGHLVIETVSEIPPHVEAPRDQIQHAVKGARDEAGYRRGMLMHAIRRSRATGEPLEQCHPAHDPYADAVLLKNGRRLLRLLAVADESAPKWVDHFEELVWGGLDPLPKLAQEVF